MSDTNKKYTTRDFYTAVAEGNITATERNYAKLAIVKLNAMNEKRKNTLSEEQITNDKLKTVILNTLENDKAYTASEVFALGIEGIKSVQHASSLLRQISKLSVSDVKIKGKGIQKAYTKSV